MILSIIAFLFAIGGYFSAYYLFKFHNWQQWLFFPCAAFSTLMTVFGILLWPIGG